MTLGYIYQKNINHEIMLDNLVINGNVIENKLSYKELSKLVDNDDPAIVNEIMKIYCNKFTFFMLTSKKYF